MKKINKKTIIFIIIIIIVIIVIHNFFVKEEYSDFETFTKEKTVNENKEENELDKNQTKDEEQEKIIVYITGEINNSGLYEMEKNSRIADVIEKAGGLRENADIKNINLAYLVEDGMKIYIPKNGEKQEEIEDSTNFYITKERDNISNENNKITIKSETKININTATQTELETLPGIGPSIALNIIDYRKKNGKFNSIEKIKEVNGIGNTKFEKIKDFIKI